jgi:fibronectin-binding autotransporter adhesin
MLLGAAAAAVVAGLVPSSARATAFVWDSTKVGAQNWQDNANWGGAGFPNAGTDTADFRVGLASNLAVDVGAPSVTVGSLFIGGTGPAVTTDIVGTGQLRLGDGTVANVISQGTAGAVNQVSAPTIVLNNFTLDATSTSNFTFAGPIQLETNNRNVTNNAPAPGGVGPVLRIGNNAASEIRLYDALDPTMARTFTFDGAANSVTEINGTFNRGPNNVGTFAYSTGSGIAGATFIYNTPQTVNTALQRATYVVNDNLAFGAGTLTVAGAGTLTQTLSFTHTNGNNATWSGTVTSTKPGGVTIPNMIIVGNSMAFAGGENIVLSGAMTQGNNRAVGNAIASGSSLTFTPDPVSNPTGISIGISRVLGDGNRTWIAEGTGTTIINGLVVNNLTDDTLAASPVINGNFEKRGSGRTELNNGGNTIRGEVRARGGNLVFGAPNSWGTPTGISVQTNGGIWYTPGVGAAGWDDGANSLVAKILPASTGFFAVPASAAGTNFDFSTGNLNLNAKNMGIGADGNVTYTGTVTPDATAGYNWGGNTGTLTLNGDNRMTGASPVTYKNGGTVIVTGSQSYTGVTSIVGANMVTSQAGILTKNLNSTSTTNVFTPTILSISQVAALGAAANDAANLVINGGTLVYTGAAGSSGRLVTVGASGATLDASGTGALALGNAGGVNVTGGTGARTLTLTGSNTGNNSLGGTLADGTLVTDTLAVTKTGVGKWVLGGANTYTAGTTVSAGTLSAAHGDAFAGGALTVADGATGMIEPNTAKGVTLATMNLNTSGKFDLTNNSMVLKTATVAAVQAEIVKAFNAGQWNGAAGLTSSTAATASPAVTAIGFASNGILNRTDFKGVQGLDPDDVLVKYTYYGDSDLNGQTTLDDYTLFLNGYQTAGTTWVQGDYDYNGLVTLDDFTLFLAGYQQQGAPLTALESLINSTPMSSADRALMLAAVQAVPEPTGLALLGLGAAGLLGRRRRQHA